MVQGKDGKVLELSLKDYLSLVMSNNTDIAIQRLTVTTADDAVLRSFSIFDPKGSASWSSSPFQVAGEQPGGRRTGRARQRRSSTVALDTLRQPASFTWSQLLPERHCCTTSSSPHPN